MNANVNTPIVSAPSATGIGIGSALFVGAVLMIGAYSLRSRVYRKFPKNMIVTQNPIHTTMHPNSLRAYSERTIV